MKETAVVRRMVAAVGEPFDFYSESPFVLEIECYLRDTVQCAWSQGPVFVVTLSNSFQTYHILHLELAWSF